MVDQMDIVTFDTPISNTLVNVTSSKITEPFSAAILIFSHEQTDSADNAHGVLGIGFIGIDGALSPEVGMAFQMANARTATPLARSLHYNATTSPTRCIKGPIGTNILTLHIEATYNASIAGGVQLNFTLVDATGGPSGGPVRTKCTAILFAGLARAATGSATSSTLGVHEDVGVSPTFFQPDVLFFLSSDGSLNTTSIADGVPNLGLAVRGGGQITSYVNVDDVTEPTDADAAVLSNKAWMISTRTAGALNLITASIAIDSTGFTATSSSGSPDTVYLALKFSGVYRAAVANLAVAAATGEQTFTDFGFTPGVVFGMGTALTTLDTATDGATASVAEFFAIGPSVSRAYTVHHEEGINITNPPVSSAHTRQEDVAELLYNHTGTVVRRATWAGPATNGFKLNYSTASQAGLLTAMGLALGLTTSDTEQVSDLSAINVGLATTDTERLTDSVVISGTGNMIAADTEQLSDQGAMAVGLAISETEQISDSVAFEAKMVLVDVETITDFVVLEAAPIGPPVAADPFGWTYGGGAERGGAFQAGAVKGTVL